jgi:hypothetical protein
VCPRVACSSVLRAAVEVVAEFVNIKGFARAFVVYERLQMRDGQSQLLVVEGCPILNHFLRLKSSDVKKPVW